MSPARIVPGVFDALIDYAGLFPPAGQSMAEAVASYARHKAGPQAAMLGRFVVPVARLAELDGELMARPPANAGEWRLTVIAGADMAADRDAVTRFHARRSGAFPAAVDSIEVKAGGDGIERIAAAWRGFGDLWIEPLLGDGLEATLARIAGCGARAKLRAGGTDASAFPSIPQVAQFIVAGATLPLSWKATAGLHHAVRGSYPLTHAPASARSVMHGFLNLLVATGLAEKLVGEKEPVTTISHAIVEVLEERDGAAFHWQPNAVRWQSHTIAFDWLRQARQTRLRSFGSCSFTEPVGELSALLDD